MQTDLTETAAFYSDDINMSLESIFRENTFLVCEECNYKTKATKALRIHTVKKNIPLFKRNILIVFLGVQTVILEHVTYLQIEPASRQLIITSYSTIKNYLNIT